MKTAQTITARVVRHFNASAERVFDAFLDPAHAKQFMFAMDGPLVRSEIEPRIGGKFAFVDRRNGEDVEHTGEFLDVDRPHRLIFTLKVPTYSQTADEIHINIEPLDRGCRLTLTHEMQGDDEAKRRAEEGWNEGLERLAKTIGAN
jgi:uncharacterized protein YndB with AHSA1/START domain